MDYYLLLIIKDLIVSICIILLLKKFKVSDMNIFLVSVFLYIIGTCLDSYCQLFFKLIGDNSIIVGCVNIYLKIFKYILSVDIHNNKINFILLRNLYS